MFDDTFKARIKAKLNGKPEIAFDVGKQQEEIEQDLVLGGFNPTFYSRFVEEFPTDDVVDGKGRVTDVFLDFYCQRANHRELTEINVNALTKKQQKIVRDALSDHSDENPEPKIRSGKVSRQKTKKAYTLVCLVWGDESVGKSEQILKFRPPVDVIDVEGRLGPLCDKLGFPREHWHPAIAYTEDGHRDSRRTLNNIRRILKDIIAKLKRGTSNGIALDGISEIRTFCVAEWREERGRVQPANAGDWGEINEKERELLFPIINLGRVLKTNVFLVAHTREKYDGLKPVEIIPGCKPYVTRNVDHIFRLERDDVHKRFTAFCTKSILDPFFFLDLTDWGHQSASIFNLLSDPEELEKRKIEENKNEEKNTRGLF